MIYFLSTQAEDLHPCDPVDLLLPSPCGILESLQLGTCENQLIWLQRRKVARPACNSAHTISEKGSRRNGRLIDQCENTGNLFGPRSKGGIIKDFLWAISWDLC